MDPEESNKFRSSSRHRNNGIWMSTILIAGLLLIAGAVYAYFSNPGYQNNSTINTPNSGFIPGVGGGPINSTALTPTPTPSPTPVPPSSIYGPSSVSQTTLTITPSPTFSAGAS